MLVYKLWQVLLDVLSFRPTFDMFVTESCEKNLSLYRREREIDVYIVIKMQGWQLPHGDISHIRHSLSFHT